ncbi:hypothetical protein DFH08DRAFT_944856 [Mycena albidolilacea]|uniref:Uncharacterized protein n=1 Tax=Mycena albidolilacea TaxID=1033008 RepID=A0AAD6Z419_9AGAR|nr:hypothetical protein DFH08DRAFT_944856 [Mycena albidolilacea]
MPSNSSYDTNYPHDHSFTAPRPAPAPPVSSLGSSNSSPSPEGFIVPHIPPPNDPVRVIRDARGHWQLPHLSEMPLHVDHRRVNRLMKYRIHVNAKCSSCAELGVDCEFGETGLPCPPCNVLGVPYCTFADPDFFMENVGHTRNTFLYEECSALCTAVHNNQLPPSSFDREYTKAQSWFYSTAQGAITRFTLNHRATDGLALRGYRALASSATDTGLLTRFISLGFETHLHPLVLQVVTDRLQAIFLALLGIP